MICSPSRCINLVDGITERRRHFGNGAADALSPPIFVWEPVPDICKPGELSNCKEAMKYVDVMSPNLEELESLLGTKITSANGQPDTEKLDRSCHELLNRRHSEKPSAIVVRMGELGARVVQSKRSKNINPYHKSLSAMKTDEEKVRWRNRVVDPTGAGNAFLGGFCVGFLVRQVYGDLTHFEMGAVFGSIAASFVVEQIGMPVLRAIDGNLKKGEQWNGDHVQDRLKTYQEALESDVIA